MSCITGRHVTRRLTAATTWKLWSCFWRHYSLAQGNVDVQLRKPPILSHWVHKFKTARTCNRIPLLAKRGINEVLWLVGEVQFGFMRKFCLSGYCL